MSTTYTPDPQTAATVYHAVWPGAAPPDLETVALENHLVIMVDDVDLSLLRGMSHPF